MEGETEYLNCRAVNPRRIEVRGAYELTASVSAQCSTEVITGLADCGIQQRLDLLQGVRRAAVLDKLISADGSHRLCPAPRRRAGRPAAAPWSKR